MKMRKFLAAMLTLVVLLGVCAIFDMEIKAQAADTATEAVVWDYIYDISPYRNTSTTSIKNLISNYDAAQAQTWRTLITDVYTKYPKKEGYIFAGWYTDVRDMIPLSRTVYTGSAYAKFVPESLFKAAAQVSTETVHTTQKTKLRFIASVDSTAYDQVGFTIKKVGTGSYIHTCTKVYSKLSATIGTTSYIDASYFSKDVGFRMFALTLTDIADQDQAYTARPFLITYDGTLVQYVATAEKTVGMGVNANKAEPATGTENRIPADQKWFDPTAEVIEIDTAEKLLTFAELSKTHDFEGKTVKLTADITLNTGDASTWATSAPGTVWTPIGSTSVPFAGTFDGQGHTISGLYLYQNGGTPCFGMFSYVKGAAIRNLTVTNSCYNSNAGSGQNGVLVGTAYGVDIDNVQVTNSVYLYGTVELGLVGRVDGATSNYFTNCSVATNIDSTEMYTKQIGGILGFSPNEQISKIYVDNCKSTVKITMSRTANSIAAYVGGLVGWVANTSNLSITDSLAAPTIDASGINASIPTSSTSYKVGSALGYPTSDKAKTVITNVYATKAFATADGTYVASGVGRDVTGEFILLDEEDYYGDSAKSNAQNLDYTFMWSAVTGNLPELSFKTDTSWYNTKDTEFTIYTAEELRGFSMLSRTTNFAGKTIKLGADIVFNGGSVSIDGTDTWSKASEVWIPISGSDAESWFAGTFDGCGHSVIGLKTVDIDALGHHHGFFGVVSGATIKNLKLNGAFHMQNESYYPYIGSVAAWAKNATIENVWSEVDLWSGKYSGGIVGHLEESNVIRNCHYTGTINSWGSKTGQYVGGIVGENVGTALTIENCLFDGKIAGTVDNASFVGGIISVAGNNSVTTLENCLSAGSIMLNYVTTDPNQTHYVGSVVGSASWNKTTTATNTYATNECAPICQLVDDTIVATGEYYDVVRGDQVGTHFSAEQIAESSITGTAAKTNLIGFDFVGTWYVREGDVPGLGIAVDEGADISWFDADVDTYTITDLADLKGLVQLSKTYDFAGKTVKLGADIVVNALRKGEAVTDWATTAPANKDWTPISNFAGTFDGQYYTISGLYSTKGGLFDTVSGTVKNLNLTGSYITGTTVGAIANTVTGKVERVYTNAIVSGTTAGGIAGDVSGQLVQGLSEATVTGTTADVVAGSVTGTLTDVFTAVDTTVGTALPENVFKALAFSGKNGLYADRAGFMDSENNGTYTIENAEDLYGFMVETRATKNTFSGKTVVLANDIAVNSEETYGSAKLWDKDTPAYNWYPIASANTGEAFAGTFDGQGYTISGIFSEHPGGNGMGLFAAVSGTVKNFRLENSYFENMVDGGYGYNASVVAALNGGTVTRVYSNAYLKTVDSMAGGIVGTMNGAAKITECQFDGVLMARCNVHGGCKYVVGAADINGEDGNGNKASAPRRDHAVFVGGIVGSMYNLQYVNNKDGYVESTATIDDCLYTGKIYNECQNAHRTGGIMGGILSDKVTITDCISAGTYSTLNRTPGAKSEKSSGNSYHFNGLLDCRGWTANYNEKGMPTNATTLFEDNYVVSTTLSDPNNIPVNLQNGEPSNLSTSNGWAVFQYNDDGSVKTTKDANNNTVALSAKNAVRYTRETLATKLEAVYANKTELDFVDIWRWNKGATALPSLRYGNSSNPVDFEYHGVTDDWSLFLEMDGSVTKDTFNDEDRVVTEAGTNTNSEGEIYPTYTIEYVKSDRTFENIDYSDGGYITKYTGVTKAQYDAYVQKFVNFGFHEGETNTVNTDDAYYTALTFGNNGYSITYFANTKELYVTASGNMKHSPYMNADYYKTAVNTEEGEPGLTGENKYDNITLTSVELSNGGLCQIIRLKNGHYIVIDGGTGKMAGGVTFTDPQTGLPVTTKTDEEINNMATEEEKDDAYIVRNNRAELANALGATIEPIYGEDENGKQVVVDYEDPKVVVDAWIFTHDHVDHAGWLYGGVFGAMQVDVYIKGFYYNFSNIYRTEGVEIIVNDQGNDDPTDDAVVQDGYAIRNFTVDYTDNGTTYYQEADSSKEAFWVEYSATHKTAANVNTPSWGGRGIPIYRLQAGQKFYFDGVTVEVPYTQDQVEPVDYTDGDLNASSAWLLFTDDYGNTFLEMGDTEVQNQNRVYVNLYGSEYSLFGADVVNAPHHGANLEADKKTGGGYSYDRLDHLFGTNKEDGTKYIIYSRGNLDALFGSAGNDTVVRANRYLTGYAYGQDTTGYTILANPIAYFAISSKADSAGKYWHGTTTISFNGKNSFSCTTKTTPNP